LIWLLEILLVSLFAKFNYLQMFPATVWKKLYVSIKINVKKHTFQLNNLLSAFVSKMFEWFDTLLLRQLVFHLPQKILTDTEQD
jgi:hypothetical protein